MIKSRVNIPNRLKVIVEEYNLSQVRSPYLEIHYTTINIEYRTNIEYRKQPTSSVPSV